MIFQKTRLLLSLFFICATTALVTRGWQVSQLEKERGLRYLTYVRDEPEKEVDIRTANFTDGKTTVFLVQGYLSFYVGKSKSLKTLIFEKRPEVERVIIVRWALVPTNQRYTNVANVTVTQIAQDVADKLGHITSVTSGPVEFVGHSLGAHISGQSGRFLENKYSKRIDKIYGLDPAGPFFEENIERAIKCTDAKEVFVIHTNTGRYGLKSKVCENDLYLHGGEIQPECKYTFWDQLCSHRAAWTYFRNKYLLNKD